MKARDFAAFADLAVFTLLRNAVVLSLCQNTQVSIPTLVSELLQTLNIAVPHLSLTEKTRFVNERNIRRAIVHVLRTRMLQRYLAHKAHINLPQNVIYVTKLQQTSEMTFTEQLLQQKDAILDKIRSKITYDAKQMQMYYLSVEEQQDLIDDRSAEISQE